MMLLVDTSVWSLALRRDAKVDLPEVTGLQRAIKGDDVIVTIGLILQELLQGFHGPKARDQIIKRFAALPLLTPDRQDHIAAAELRNICRRAGVQLGTIDALIAQLCIHYELTLLTTDRDFQHASKHIPLQVWMPG
ncbi:MAG: PIN domain-containing protein [Pyrinomonadaceae bacterium]|nr:PIN domain-containing protein [Pyrinomonadaceae bacterium]